ncbi:hypothetical protein ASG01_10145 [Chryseobacterium sp. Leaf180]|uniref:hypothetical protein n=1 Tax=Chryseobacterium sp. Leaf180 TaxID=1736289 RepID=UPI0006F370EF|nr:hypothetical protein [Chryseobacterium sp. Leaf180]KQR93525.1 hypothetical protein ASG01_10145 [Chryseobacterium sp. Leaf180]
MKKVFFLLILVISNFSLCQKQRLTDVGFYYGFSEYQKDSLAKPNVYADIKNQNDSYIKISDFRFVDSNKKAKMENSAWLMKLQDKLYFNMLYASHIYSFDTYAKVNLVGKKYFLIYLDEQKDKKAIGATNPYGGSLIGLAIYADLKSRVTWKDKKGKSYTVLLIDVENKDNVGDKRDVSFGRILDTKLILKISNDSPEVISKLKNNNFYLENVIDLVNEVNIK